MADPRWMPREQLRDGLGSGQEHHSCNDVTHSYSHMVCPIDLNACFNELLGEPAGKCAISKSCGAISSSGGCLALSTALEVAEIRR